MSVSPHVALAPTYRRNLRRLYARATDADIREGSAWYPTAVDGCQIWAARFGYDPRTVACVIAAISPQCDWTSNLRIAFELLSGQTLVTGGALRANVEKARHILATGATSIYPTFKDAPKVDAFAQNLAGNTLCVTIDNHAVQAARNTPTTVISVHTAAYRVFEGCYRDVAASLELRPCHFQAIIWCAWKRRYSPARKRALIGTLARFMHYRSFRSETKGTRLSTRGASMKPCRLCGGDLQLLGCLGRLLWVKCRHCGMEFSRTARKVRARKAGQV